MVVSRWFVTPIAAMSLARQPGTQRAHRAPPGPATPDRFGVVLDVSRRREDLLELLLRDGHDGAVMPKDNGTARGRALIESEHEAAHTSASSLTATSGR